MIPTENKRIRSMQKTARDLEHQAERVESRANKEIQRVAERKAPVKKYDFVKLTDRGRSTYWRVTQVYGRFTPMDTDVRWILHLSRTASNGDARYGTRVLNELECRTITLVASGKPFKIEAVK